ncbi:MAG: Rne/Rng family ribonuclease [Planctomycetes bacterium]|nr:Rne/Rng family ribonuclease [Planctomycetota bacterium]
MGSPLSAELLNPTGGSLPEEESSGPAFAQEFVNDPSGDESFDRAAPSGDGSESDASDDGGSSRPDRDIDDSPVTDDEADEPVPEEDEEDDDDGGEDEAAQEAEAESQTEEVVGKDIMLVNASEPEELRIAVMDDKNVLNELYVDTISRSSVLGNIYKGRVVNVEPSIGAAFVDFGIGRNGFLHASDVLAAYGDPAFELTDLPLAKAGEDEGPEAVRAVVDDPDEKRESPPQNGGSRRDRKSIADLLHRGAEVVVQVTKDGIGLKGPTLTTYISIPGRSLVLMPSLPRCGVSRKISDERERRRLKRLLNELVPDQNIGFIVRTAGANRTRMELQRDLDYLLNLWEVFKKRLVQSRAPVLMYEESDLCTTTMRDIFSPHIGRVVVDSEPVYKRMREFCERIMPRYADRVELWNEPTPIFHRYGAEAEFQKLFLRKVTLANGSSLVFDQAEALVAIDVNSGKARQESDLEETAYRTNMEAIPEIVRQIRLRDLGGIIVVDFIDMMESRHRRTVEKSFRDAMRNDRARIKIGRISQFGLLEMTRQRLGPGLQRSLFQPCQSCGGGGYAKTPEAMSLSVLRELTAAVRKKGFATLEVALHPDAMHYLTNVKREHLYNLEDRSGKNIIVVGDQRLGPGEVRYRYLTGDGRETKPVSG